MFVLDYVGQTLSFCGRIVKDIEPVASRFLWVFATDLHGRYIVLATEFDLAHDVLTTSP